MERQKKGKRILDIIFYIFIFIIVSISILNIYSLKKGKQPSLFGYGVFYIMTGSMEPTISKGSLVIDKVKNYGDIKDGDIVTFKGENTITTHRVYKVIDGGQRFITKGDANNAEDPGFRDKKDILGVVKVHIPILGNIIEIIKNNLIIISLMIIGLIIAKVVYKKIK